MGGKAFSQSRPELRFPRLSPARYRSLLATLRPRLETLFASVVTPAEAPEKPDHGDIDFLVASPLNGVLPTPEEAVDDSESPKLCIDLDAPVQDEPCIPLAGSSSSIYPHTLTFKHYSFVCRRHRRSTRRRSGRCSSHSVFLSPSR